MNGVPLLQRQEVLTCLAKNKNTWHRSSPSAPPVATSRGVGSLDEAFGIFTSRRGLRPLRL